MANTSSGQNPPNYTKSEISAGEQAKKEAEVDQKKAEEAAKAAAKVAEEQEKERKKKEAELKAADDAKQKEAKASSERSDKAAAETKSLKEKEAADCLEKATAILKEYGGAESNIPMGSDYWSLMNRYRAIARE